MRKTSSTSRSMGPANKRERALYRSLVEQKKR